MITVKENYDEWLQYVDPSTNALLVYLSRQQDGGAPVAIMNSFIDENGKNILVMNNGFSYTKNDHHRWMLVK